jgi:hypothetical protein
VLTRTFFGRPVRSVTVATLLCLIGTALFAGGAQAKTTVKAAWEGGASHKQAFTRVLVVGVSPNVNQRCAFEFFMASRLKSDTVQVFRSCDAVKEKNPLTLESIEQAIAAVQADAVLATSLVSRALKGQEGGSRDTRGNASYKATDAGFATGYYGVYGVPVIYGEGPCIYGGRGRGTGRVEVLPDAGQGAARHAGYPGAQTRVDRCWPAGNCRCHRRQVAQGRTDPLTGPRMRHEGCCASLEQCGARANSAMRRAASWQSSRLATSEMRMRPRPGLPDSVWRAR